ncbi:potassium transporter KefB [Rufibacter immobilis]|uniref:potassium transporter KefB n=1 Tax=Rufibacter immobilis TaxID=1348778 RepID=UPI0035EB41D0
MTQQKELTNPALSMGAFVKPMMIGAGIALLVISFFVFGVDAPHPDWGKYWRVRPLIVTPLAGAMGGAFYTFMVYQSSRGFNRTLAILLSLIVYIVGLWLGIVAGLDTTMWD